MSGISTYVRHIGESLKTIAGGMWITFKTAFLERKVTLQYPSFDVHSGRSLDGPEEGRPRGLPGPLLGAGQDYRGPLSPTLQERFRGQLGFEDGLCITCLQCSRACPIEVITVEGVKIEGRKAKAPTIFRVDNSKCMYCGLCVEVCPTEAVFFTQTFEGATFDCQDLIKEFITAETRMERLRSARELKEKKAREKAAKEAAEEASGEGQP